jgi:predicted TPR repeat methyltransferase
MMNPKRHRIRLPEIDFSRKPESDVYFLLDNEHGSERVRFHDYDRIYSVPGLYEQLFYDRFKCDSPRFLAQRLNEVVTRAGEDLHSLRTLDFGAGNGMVGEALMRYGVSRLVGVDISESALEALERDRPGLYDAYYVADLSRPDPDIRESLITWHFTCMTTVAALGFNDIPESAFREAFNLVADNGWIAFNIKETFLGESDQGGFSTLIKRLIAGESLHLHHLERYRHRISSEGNPLYYYAAIGRKLAPLDKAA